MVGPCEEPSRGNFFLMRSEWCLQCVDVVSLHGFYVYFSFLLRRRQRDDFIYICVSKRSVFACKEFLGLKASALKQISQLKNFPFNALHGDRNAISVRVYA